MSNLVVVYEPNSEGQEYKLISGERRLEALKSLYNKGHKEYEYVTCQVKKEQSEEEEEIEIIIANSSRVKTTAEMLQEAAKLKSNLEKMRDEGKQLKGFDLNKGRLRDVVASILNMSKTKVAQIENINNNLDPNFRKELEEGNLNFATANEIAGIDKEKQEELYEKQKDNIKDLRVKDIKDIKEQIKENEQLEDQIDTQEVINNIDNNNNSDILEKFEDGKRYVFSIEAYKKYCQLHGEAVGGPDAPIIDWMKDLEGKEPGEIVTEVSARIYTQDGYKYLRPYYFREMTKYEIEKKEEQIKNEKKLQRLEALRFEPEYTYKYSFEKKAEYEFLKHNVILRDKSRWDRENDGKEVKVITSKSAKLGDYRINPWECTKSKKYIYSESEDEAVIDLSEDDVEDEEIIDLSEDDSELEEEALEVLESMDRYNLTNLEKIKTFDSIYMSEFIFRLVNLNCDLCPVKQHCRPYKLNSDKEVKNITCKREIRNWLKEDNTLENEFPGGYKNE